MPRFVSSKIAQIRKIYHSTEPMESIKIHLEANKLQVSLALTQQQIDIHRQMFADNPYLEVTYESFVANRDYEA